jgi:diacylglycerol kinase family enzyme
MAFHVLLVGNPTAQSGRAAARIERALESMRSRGWWAAFLPTEPAGGTVSSLRDRLDRERFDAVVYLGGDGTFAEVAKGDLASQRPIPMGMLPSGTANDQGKSFGVSADEAALEENLETIAAGHLTRLDVGRICRLDDHNQVMDTDLFFDSAGFGMNPEILAWRNRDREVVSRVPLLRELYRDQAVYAGAALKQYLASFAEPTKFDAEVLCDGEVAYAYGGLTDLVIQATPIYGGEWVLAPEGEPDDGRFEVVPVQGRRDWVSRIIRDLAVLPLGQHHLERIGVTHCEGFSGSRFEIRLSRPRRQLICSQIDGEQWLLGDRFRIEVLAGLLPLITPADWSPPWKGKAGPQ